MASRRHIAELPTITEIETETETESSDVSMEAATTLTIDDAASGSSSSKKRGRDDDDDEYYGRRADVADDGDDDVDDIVEMVAELTVVPSSKPAVIFEYDGKCKAMKKKASELVASLKIAAPGINLLIKSWAREGTFVIKMENGKICIYLRNQRSPYHNLRRLVAGQVVEEIISMVNQQG